MYVSHHLNDQYKGFTSKSTFFYVRPLTQQLSVLPIPTNNFIHRKH